MSTDLENVWIATLNGWFYPFNFSSSYKAWKLKQQLSNKKVYRVVLYGAMAHLPVFDLKEDAYVLHGGLDQVGAGPVGEEADEDLQSTLARRADDGFSVLNVVRLIVSRSFIPCKSKTLQLVNI